MQANDILYIPDNKGQRLTAETLDRLAGIRRRNRYGLTSSVTETGPMRKEEIVIPKERAMKAQTDSSRRPSRLLCCLSRAEKEAPLSGPSLSQYLWVVKRHRWKLLAFVVFSVIATVIVSKRLTPLYESTAVIDIDRQTPAAVLGNESTAAVNSADVENYLTTQEQIVQSDAVLRPVVEKYHLMTPALRKLANDPLLSSRLKDAPIELQGSEDHPSSAHVSAPDQLPVSGSAAFRGRGQ